VDFFSDGISSFGAILAHVAWPKAQTLSQNNFSLETRLESMSFKHLIVFLAFLVQKL